MIVVLPANLPPSRPPATERTTLPPGRNILHSGLVDIIFLVAIEPMLAVLR